MQLGCRPVAVIILLKIKKTPVQAKKAYSGTEV